MMTGKFGFVEALAQAGRVAGARGRSMRRGAPVPLGVGKPSGCGTERHALAVDAHPADRTYCPGTHTVLTGRGGVGG